ncbi:MAG: hypothetical protein AAGJ34_00625 [Pseudomonadota bacterium]
MTYAVCSSTLSKSVAILISLIALFSSSPTFSESLPAVSCSYVDESGKPKTLDNWSQYWASPVMMRFHNFEVEHRDTESLGTLEVEGSDSSSISFYSRCSGAVITEITMWVGKYSVGGIEVVFAMEVDGRLQLDGQSVMIGQKSGDKRVLEFEYNDGIDKSGDNQVMWSADKHDSHFFAGLRLSKVDFERSKSQRVEIGAPEREDGKYPINAGSGKMIGFAVAHDDSRILDFGLIFLDEPKSYKLNITDFNFDSMDMDWTTPSEQVVDDSRYCTQILVGPEATVGVSKTQTKTQTFEFDFSGHLAMSAEFMEKTTAEVGLPGVDSSEDEIRYMVSGSVDMGVELTMETSISTTVSERFDLTIGNEAYENIVTSDSFDAEAYDSVDGIYEIYEEGEYITPVGSTVPLGSADYSGQISYNYNYRAPLTLPITGAVRANIVGEKSLIREIVPYCSGSETQ